MRACLIPLAAEPRNPAANLERLLQRLDKVAPLQPDLICLPECSLTGYIYSEADFAQFAESIPGPTTERLGRLAREHRAHFCLGMVEHTESGAYNSAVLLDRTGRIILRHRKIREKPPFIVGDTVDSVDTDLGRLGILICGDLFDPVTVQKLNAAPDWLIVPMARGFDGRSPDIGRWDTKERRAYLDAVSAAGVPALIVNALGISGDDPSFGGALVVSGDGVLLAESTHGTDDALVWDSSLLGPHGTMYPRSGCL